MVQWCMHHIIGSISQLCHGGALLSQTPPHPPCIVLCKPHPPLPILGPHSSALFRPHHNDPFVTCHHRHSMWLIRSNKTKDLREILFEHCEASTILLSYKLYNLDGFCKPFFPTRFRKRFFVTKAKALVITQIYKWVWSPSDGQLFSRTPIIVWKKWRKLVI